MSARSGERIFRRSAAKKHNDKFSLEAEYESNHAYSIKNRRSRRKYALPICRKSPRRKDPQPWIFKRD